MAYHVGTGRMVLFGGQGAEGRLADTWIYEPETLRSVWSPLVVLSQ
jgi:hypothetical protein